MDMSLMKRELTQDEALRLKPYRCTAGKLTIGVGRNLDDVGITANEADYLLENDIGRAMADLDRALPWWRGLSDSRQRALVNMCFNLGLTRLLGFKGMLSALESGDGAEAAREALDSAWARQVGGRAQRIAKMLVEG
jgi:lysozyme